MLKELLEELNKVAVRAAGPQVTKINRTDTFISYGNDGHIVKFNGEPQPRDHRALDLETIAAFADRFKDTYAIWYSRDGITFLADDTDRQHKVTIEMKKSDQINCLMNFEREKPLLPPEQLVRTLRTVFTASAFQSCNLIELLRKTKFTSNGESTAEVTRGRTSLGRSITAEAALADTFPEQVTISIPIFFNSFARKTQDIICAVEVREKEEKFQLFPLPGEVEKAFCAAESLLCKSIMDLVSPGMPMDQGVAASDIARVYYGRP